jgi:hypothetical protein
MDVWCVYVFILCLGRGLAMSWSLIQGVLPTVYKIKETEVNRSFTDALCSRGRNRNKKNKCDVDGFRTYFWGVLWTSDW